MRVKNKILSTVAVATALAGAFFVKSWLYPPNLLLKKPVKTVFSREDRLKRDWREGGFHAISDKRKLSIYFQEKFENKRNHYFILTYFRDLPDELSEEHKKLFKHESRVIDGQKIDLYSYSTGHLQKPERWLKVYNEMLDMVLSEKPSKPTGVLALSRDFSRTKQKQSPEKISAEKCASLLKNKRFLFYTGAGLSMAVGIPTGMQVRKSAGRDRTKDVDQFVINVLTNPQAIIDVHKRFEESFRHVEPTEAHLAIADMVSKYNAHVITSNVDKLHEQTGVKAWNIMAEYTYDSWLGKKPIPESGNFAYLQANPKWLKDIDFVICVGMSTDVKGFLAWYKKHNPNGKIIAVNESEIPYLGNEDYFIQGDAQEIIPAIAEALSKEKIPSVK